MSKQPEISAENKQSNREEEVLDTEKTREIYRLICDGKWNYLRELYERKEEFKRVILFDPITVAGDTVLHFAVRYVKELRNLLKHLRNVEDKKRALSMENYYGDTPLHMAASLGNLESTELLLNHCPELFDKKNKNGETAMYRTAIYGHKKVLKHLFNHLLNTTHYQEYEDFPKKLEDQCTRYDGLSILHVAVRGRHIGTALWIENNIVQYYFDPSNALDQRKDKRGRTCLQLLAGMKDIFESGFSTNNLERLVYWCVPVESIQFDDDQEDSTISSRKCGDMDRIRWTVLNFFAKGWPVINDIRKKKKKHALAVALTKLLALNDISWEQSYEKVSKYGDGDHRDKESSNNEDTISPQKSQASNLHIGPHTPDQEARTINIDEEQPLTPLLLAAKNGIIEIVNIILEAYPQAIDHVSPNWQNILHIAIQHRQRKIFSLVKKNSISIDRLLRRKDKDGNNILHQVGVVEYCHPEGLTNPALQLQDELRWFERVKKLVPKHYVAARNKKDRKTPKEYFDKTHQGQLTEAHNWSKDTSESCSTVAALIATIVFAAAYTVPGGSENGVPVLLRSNLFKIFTVMDILSLGSSLTSLVLFLSILTSPFEYKDFYVSIPRRMMFGFSFLLISVASTMIAFTVTILLTVRLKKEWTRSLIYVVGFLPVSLFALYSFPLIAGFKITWKETRKILKNLLPDFQACSPCCLKRNYRTIKTTPSIDDSEDPQVKFTPSLIDDPEDPQVKFTPSLDDPEDPQAA